MEVAVTAKLKKIGSLLFSAAVVGMLLVPAVCLPFQKPNEDNSENRKLSEFPSWTDDTGSWNESFFDNLDTWFSEHFAFRAQLVTAYGDLTRNVFSTSSNTDVIVGKDGWLYYTPTVQDITGVRTVSDTDIRHMVKVLQLMQDYAEANGAQFIFACAPNKGSIYPEYLPARYLRTGGENNLDLLHHTLAESGVKVCDLREVLRSAAAEREELIYHKLDTHWNNDGAMIGYQALMQTAGLDDRGYAEYPRTEAFDWEGDLWKMLSPDEENPDRNTYYALPETHKPVGRYRGVDDLLITMSCESGEGSLLMFRDSFSRALIPILSERFADSVYARAEHTPINRIETTKTDVVIYELVERNLTNLIYYSPLMPAPEATPDGQEANAPDAAPITLDVIKEYGFAHFYGTYDARLADGTAIYCTVTDTQTGEAHTYEAFPIYEAALEGREENGFSFYLPYASVPENGTLDVRIQREGLLVSAGTQAFSWEPETEE